MKRFAITLYVDAPDTWSEDDLHVSISNFLTDRTLRLPPHVKWNAMRVDEWKDPRDIVILARGC